MISGVGWTILIYTIALPILAIGGNHACRIILKTAGARITRQAGDAAKGPTLDAGNPDAGVELREFEDEKVLRAGRTIGSLERILIMIGLIAHSWEVMIAVIALKTVARYQDLDKRVEAEYFLVGSLVSILWAVAVTLFAMLLDSALGINVGGMIRELIGG